MQTVSGHSPRLRGSGSLLVHRSRGGTETWYGKWWVGGRQVMRVLGPAEPDGLSYEEANRLLARRIAASKREEVSLESVGRRYLAHSERIGRRPSTIEDYDSYLRLHLLPFFGNRPLRKITPLMVEEFIERECRRGTSLGDRRIHRSRPADGMRTPGIIRRARGHSSVGRAPGSHPGGQRFEPAWLHCMKALLMRGFLLLHRRRGRGRNRRVATFVATSRVRAPSRAQESPVVSADFVLQ